MSVAESESVRGRLPTPARPRLTARAAWTVFAAGALADLATTAVGLHVGAVETNPVGNAALLAAGFPALCALKSGAAGVAATGWCATPDWCHAAPATVGALWLSIAAWNAVIVGVIVA